MRQNKSIEKTYQKKSQVEHILLRPQMYIGPISTLTEPMWILSEYQNQFINKKIQYCPGLYKIFDEILVNAADNFQRDHRMKRIQVTLDKSKGISVLNDGESIPIAIHKQHNIYVAELIFGHLLTGSNYQDEDKKVTGGRNGYGAKLANIFSNKFQVETGNSSTQKQLKIKWSDNMSKMEEPVIKTVQDIDNFTKITFVPDFKRFGMKQLNTDMIQLMKKRVYDLAGTMRIKVYLNGELIKIKSFDQYVGYYGQKQDQVITLESSKKWKVLVTCQSSQFQQVSFVNSICTYKGGTHINHIMDQIVEKITEAIKKKNKTTDVKPAQIKGAFSLFVNCLIENPIFDSQTKDNLVSKPSTYGSQFVLQDKAFKQIIKSGVVERILSMLKNKESQKLSKQLKKKKGDRLTIDKLEDANLAGTRQHCTLILTEGDSAKALAVCGLSIVGRDKYGVFPLRGKILNVRDLSMKQIADNQELKNVIQILGLQFNKQYTSTDELRYQTVMIMADQDNDGSHIKGLILNFFSTFWPSLCNQKGFLKQFITPILKCKKGDLTQSFFSAADYEKWKDRNGGAAGWKIKYYKGLGTSTSLEAKQYFSNLNKHQICFQFKGECFNSLDMAFNKKLAHLRKEWIAGYNPANIIDYTQKKLSVTNFINLQLINFSRADNLRSIPSLIDGLKPSQRKILFSCFKRNLKNQIKVSQLSGYVAENSAYHHGQMSLNMTIIGMAQNYVGSNNLNLLMPNGQFGTRSEGGKDCASSRYIYTQLNPLTRLIFPEVDDHIVDYLEEENQSIEPSYYYPILPMVLINGTEGIGMGWSTSISPFKVKDVIKMMRARINGESYAAKIGWQNFKGTIQQLSKDKYLIKGRYKVNDTVVTITELPIKKWTNDYKKFLLQKLQTSQNRQYAQIQDVKEYHTFTDINFVVSYIPEKFPENIEKTLKLSATVQNSNMVLFDSNYQLKKYQSIEEIINEFYQTRIGSYEKRRRYLLSKIYREMQITEAKLRFIQSIISQTFSLKGSKQDWIKNLIKQKYQSFDAFPKVYSTKISQGEEEGNNDIKDFNYLLNLPIWSFTSDKVEELENALSALSKEHRKYEQMSCKEMWLEDIKVFEQGWLELNPTQRVDQQPQAQKSKKSREHEKKKPSPAESAKQPVSISDSEDEIVIKRIRKKVSVLQIKDDVDQREKPEEITFKSKRLKKKGETVVQMEVEQPFEVLEENGDVDDRRETFVGMVEMVEQKPEVVQDLPKNRPPPVAFQPTQAPQKSFLSSLFEKYLGTSYVEPRKPMEQEKQE